MSNIDDIENWEDERLAEAENDDDDLSAVKFVERRRRTKVRKEEEQKRAEAEAVARRKAEEEARYIAEELERRKKAEEVTRKRAEEVWAEQSSGSSKGKERAKDAPECVRCTDRSLECVPGPGKSTSCEPCRGARVKCERPGAETMEKVVRRRKRVEEQESPQGEKKRVRMEVSSGTKGSEEREGGSEGSGELGLLLQGLIQRLDYQNELLEELVALKEREVYGGRRKRTKTRMRMRRWELTRAPRGSS